MASTDPKGHNPTAIDKWLLVLYKRYPSKDQIPNSISAIMMRRVHDQARVHFSLGIMVVGALGLFANALINKRAGARNDDSLDKMMHDYQESYNKRKEEEFKNKSNK